MPIINQVVKGGGTTPTGTKSITANGIYDVTNFASADVQVPTTAPAHYIEKTVDANGKLVSSGASFINLSGVTSIGQGSLAFSYANASFPANTSIDMGYITTIAEEQAMTGMFSRSTGIISVDLSGLTVITGNNACNYMFESCVDLASIDISSLTTASATGCISGMFNGCSSLTTLTLSSLTTVYNLTSFAFNCSNLKTASFPKLNVITQYLGSSYQEPFYGCVKLEDVYLGGLTSSTFSTLGKIGQIFNNVTGRDAPNGCTLHFPSNFDPTDPDKTFDASTLTGYPTFGGNASYIHLAFDLPATE